MLSVNRERLEAQLKQEGSWIGPAPWIEVAPPGPHARAVMARDRVASAPNYLRVYPLVVERAAGSVVQDVDGNRYLDFAAGTALSVAGHCHPKVTVAVQQQAAKLLHVGSNDFYHEAMVALMEKLAQLAPGHGPRRVLLTTSGAEAVEAAFKLARYHTGRQWVVAFHGAFHGRSMGALSLTWHVAAGGQPPRSEGRPASGFEPLVPMVAHVPYDEPEALESELRRQRVDAAEVAAVFVEPVLATAGYVVPAPAFFTRLRALCDRHGMLLVADEIHTGMGRSGQWFAIQHSGVTPDMVLLGAGLAGGLPLGAVIAGERVDHWPTGALTSTVSGNPLSCAAALATIEVVERVGLGNAARLGERLRALLGEIAGRRKCLAGVRGVGLMGGLDVVNRKSGKLDHHLRDRILSEAFRRGLIVLPCGAHCIRFCPPLVLNETQLEVGLQLFDEAVATVV
ncbi:MAG TPA: aminotransferase class III-fold pyridoxal phosphate-dependent enzyme [Phycisphaerae bacterium]|nr:aminotransferase class III-fold pyridoxal phosphate-dependent enzyme [Phycisphaerae bacterium]HNU46045.1 aminotransferase class III-fold pyridoxal phosphate-dependent enzyme [Phycisphaerae bacterium]